MDIPLEFAMGTLRLSTGKYTTIEEIDRAVMELTRAVKSLKSAESQGRTFSTIEDIKLTHFTHGLGCACKLRPQDLEKVLSDMPTPVHPDILVGKETSDDAAVYKISPDLALVQTVDFFTPIVDDPYQFGAITVANSLSDIYAMGGEPLFALNIVAFPSKRLPLEVLRQILKGAEDKAAEAGLPILGGHSIEDNEPKYGLAVTGSIHPDRIWKNSSAKPGDYLVLTKPIGTGVLSTALKRGLLPEGVSGILFDLMSRLNKNASGILKKYDINAVTDVTGFGLLGHLCEITKASNVNAELWVGKVPVLDHVKEFLASNIIPGGTINNLDFVSEFIKAEPGISRIEKLMLADAQTSGGLLFSIPEEQIELTHKAFREKDEPFFVIGKITENGEGIIYLKN